ncbi:MAG: transglutaminase-like domain-containing protein [Desulfurococcaceae archaeon]
MSGWILSMIELFLKIIRRKAVLVVLLIVLSSALTYTVTSSHYGSTLRSYEVRLLEVEAQYSRLLNVAYGLNESLSKVVGMLRKYCCVPHVLPMVLNEDEVVAMKWYIVNIGVDPRDEWITIERIYSWVRRNIGYISDPRITIVDHRYTCTTVDSDVYCIYDFREVKDYVQPPTETIRRGGGDCEDHAILVYALLTYYFKYLRGVNYTIWLAFMELADGSKHAAVFIPVREQGLLIVDTSIGFISMVNSTLMPRSPLEELEEYFYFHLSSGGISSISLYSVNTETGSYKLEVSGGLATVASFITRYIESYPGLVLPRRG